MQVAVLAVVCSQSRALRRTLARSVNCDERRETRAQPVLEWVSLLEHYFDGNPLDDLGKVPRRVVGRKESELRSPGRSDFRNLSVEKHTGKGVDSDISRVSLPNVGKLRFLIIRLNPDVSFDQVDYLHARPHQLTCLHMTFSEIGRA